MEHNVRIILTNYKNEVVHEKYYKIIGEYCIFTKKYEIDKIKFGWLWYDTVEQFRDKIMSVYDEANKFEIILN